MHAIYNGKNANMLQLTSTEKEHYLEFIGRATAVSAYSDFYSLINNELRKLIPYSQAICGLGYITPQETVQAHKLISFDFPVEYLKAISTKDGGFTSPKMANWMQSRIPQLFEDNPEEVDALPGDWVKITRRYGLKNMASHGMHDLQGRCTSYFTFCNLPERLGERHIYLLQLVVPILHAALVKVADEVPPLGIEPVLYGKVFTPREIELLRFIANGKKKKDIALTLGISENTVRNHLNNLYAKLGVNKATQAIERGKILRLL